MLGPLSMIDSPLKLSWRRTMPTINGRCISSIGKWNVKLLGNKESEMIQDVKYELNILQLCEMKVRGNNMRGIGRAKYVYTGVTGGRARGGVGIIVSELWADWLRSWRCMSKRCVMIRLRIQGMLMDSDHTGVCFNG